MRSQFRPAIVLFIVLTILTGIIYPAVVTALAKTAFGTKAAGSVIEKDGKAVGSELIGQAFSDPRYFWSRPSATSPVPYAADSGSGSNLGPTNPALVDAVKQRIAALHAADPEQRDPVPVDLVTASASGLDPHISIAAASYQAGRIARARHLPPDTVQKLIERFSESSVAGLPGEPRVNVLKINLALDGLSRDNGSAHG